jgi:hypothetical protein
MKMPNVSSIAALISLPTMFSMLCAGALAAEIESSSGPVQQKGVVEQILGNRVQMVSDEVPIQSYLSIPMPTKRFGQSAFASFSCPEHLVVGQKPDIAPPDRWWLFDERAKHLLCYSIIAVTPFAQPMPHPGSGDAPVAISVDEKGRLLAQVLTRIDTIAPAFFKDDTRPRGQRLELLRCLSNYVGAELLPYYQALAPDFFAWLEAE